MLMTSSFVCATLNLGRKKSTGTEPKTCSLRRRRNVCPFDYTAFVVSEKVGIP